MKIKKYPRINYWNCSKFADIIRGVEKPYALPFDRWDSWRQKEAKKRPFRYWVAENVLDFFQDLVNFPFDIYYTISIYIRNRFIDKIHYLKTGLKPGEYYDLDDRILYGLFNELVNMIEIEYAHIMKYQNKEHNYVFNKGRCPLAGLDFLNWSSRLKLDESYGFNKDSDEYGEPTSQAITAKKMLELYEWWKNRPDRTNPHSMFTFEQDGRYYYRKIGEIQDIYDREDTNMLIELIKIRSSLWT